jgi:hypothetical protein
VPPARLRRVAAIGVELSAATGIVAIVGAGVIATDILLLHQ